jgi:arginyl-tRNA synthetase
MLANAADLGMTLPADFDSSLLAHPREGDLLRSLADYPGVVASAADLREPHRIARYLEDLVAVFNRWYDERECRMLPQGDEPVAPVNEARMALVVAAQTVIRNGLDLLGVSAPERM